MTDEDKHKRSSLVGLIVIVLVGLTLGGLALGDALHAWARGDYLRAGFGLAGGLLIVGITGAYLNADVTK